MQVEVDVTCMHTNFGRCAFLGFGDIATLKNGQISLFDHGLLYSGYISSEFNFVLFVLILFERNYSERKFNVGVTASSGHMV